MRRIPWPWVAITAGGMLMMAAMALAQIPPTTPERRSSRPPPFGMERTRLFCDSPDSLVAGGLAFLHSKLAIAAEQEAAWGRFAEATGRSVAPLADICANDLENPPGTLPDHFARGERDAAARLEVLQALHPAIQDLYAVLSDEQRRRADALPFPGGR